MKLICLQFLSAGPHGPPAGSLPRYYLRRKPIASKYEGAAQLVYKFHSGDGALRLHGESAVSSRERKSASDPGSEALSVVVGTPAPATGPAGLRYVRPPELGL